MDVVCAHCKKWLPIFPSPAEMSPNSSWPGMWTGKSLPFLYSAVEVNCAVSHKHSIIPTSKSPFPNFYQLINTQSQPVISLGSVYDLSCLVGEKEGVCTETCLETGLELELDTEQGEGAGSSCTTIGTALLKATAQQDGSGRN